MAPVGTNAARRAREKEKTAAAEGLCNVPISDWRRVESRSEPGRFYYVHEGTGQTSNESPTPWEKIESQTHPGERYYFNRRTGESSWNKPSLETDAKTAKTAKMARAALQAHVTAKDKQKEQKRLAKVRSEPALGPERKVVHSKPCQHHATHLKGAIVERGDSPRHALRKKKSVDGELMPRMATIKQGSFEPGLTYTLRDQSPDRKVRAGVTHEADHEFGFSESHLSSPFAVLSDKQEMFHKRVAREEDEPKLSNDSDQVAALLQDPYFLGAMPKARSVRSLEAPYAVGDAESPRALLAEVRSERGPPGHMLAGCVVHTPRAATHQLELQNSSSSSSQMNPPAGAPETLTSNFEKYLAVGPRDDCPWSPERSSSVGGRSGRSHLKGAQVIQERGSPVRLPYRKSECTPRDNFEGSGCDIPTKGPPEGIRTFPHQNKVDGAGAIVIAEPETRLMAHFEPSAMDDAPKSVFVRHEPKWLTNERRRHFFKEKHVAAHLQGSSAEVVSEAEPRLLCSLGGFRDFPVKGRRWFPDWDHLEGAGVDEIVDNELGASDLAHQDEMRVHRVQMQEKDHLKGAGVYEVLDLTPRRARGKRVDDHNQKSGQDGKWWEHQHSSWVNPAGKNFPSLAVLAAIQPPPLPAAGLSFTSHIQGRTDSDVGTRSGARTPPRYFTPRSETPRSETPRQAQQARSITPRSMTPRSETPRSETPRSELPRSRRLLAAW